jgi:hypothetical protein
LTATAVNDVSHDVYLQFRVITYLSRVLPAATPLDRLHPRLLPYARLRVLATD